MASVLSAAERMRDQRRRTGRMLAVLDDDPTGSQSVHQVQIVTALERSEYAPALRSGSRTGFVLTNTRGMPESEAVRLTEVVAGDLHAVAAEIGRPLDIVSRSDSTLRGHVVAEVRALDAAKRRFDGRGYDAVLFAPAFFEAGRVTHDDVHWLADEHGETPVGDSEFARDATFGYRSSALPAFLAERSAGAVRADDVISVGLDDIRTGGVDRVAEILRAAVDGAFVVVNGTEYADYEVVASAALRVQEEGRSLLYRTGPSFVRALAGLDASEPLRSTDVWPHGSPDGHGLVVVGSHVGRTTEQLERLLRVDDLVQIELDAASVARADDVARGMLVQDLTQRVRTALRTSDVVLSTSRQVVVGDGPDGSLAISLRVSGVLSDVVNAALDASPAWLIAKGGITSHDVAVRGLAMRRATVVGQFGPGIVSLLCPVVADPRAEGMPFVVFPGNVGDAGKLVHVVRVLRSREDA